MDLEQNDINGSQFNMNCTNFTVEDLKVINRTRNIPAMICAVITLAILLYLMYYKAYSSLLQRLYLYLVVGTLFTEIAVALNIEHQWHYKGQETVCVWLGFFTQWTYVLVFIFSYEIVLYLLYLVMLKIRGTPLPPWMGSKCCTVTVEIIYIVTPLLISTTFAVFPYVKRSYGVAGPWCWVVSLNGDCEPSGFVTQMVFYSMYMAVGVVGIAASLVFLIVYFKLATSFREARQLLKQTLYVMVFQFIHILIVMCNLTLRLYTLLSRRHEVFGLWLAHAFTIPLGVLVFPLGYLLCFYPVKIVQIVYKKIAAFKCCKHKSSNKYVEAQSVTRHATAPVSDRITQPSDTFFVVPHPDMVSEKSPLLSDAGYISAQFTKSET